jgi:3-ketoacyl-CoA synthase
MSSSTKPSSSSSSSTKASNAPLKSYWYPDRRAELGEVREGYQLRSHLSLLLAIVGVPVIAGVVATYGAQHATAQEMLRNVRASIHALQQQEDKEVLVPLAVLLLGVVAILVLLVVYFARRSRPVYLLDFAVYTGHDKNKVPQWFFTKASRDTGFFSEEALQFQTKLLARTGLGEETYMPDSVVTTPPVLTMAAARAEALEVLATTMSAVLASTGKSKDDIDILIVNCSLFNPTPSLTSMMVNHFKLKSSVRTYNLSGMGCSAGVIAIDLARDLLQVHSSSVAVVLSTENITQNWYTGNDRSMLVSNTLFRMGASAVLLSNRWRDQWRAKYRLLTTVRVHQGADDKSYEAVYQKADETGKVGVSLSPHLLTVIGGALKSNMTRLGPQVLPWSEQIRFFAQLCLRRVLGADRVPNYVPDFKKAFEHFAIHAGGRAIIDGLQENLSLSDYQVEPSRATLYRYGNTSSSSVFYELNYIERDGRVKAGDRVWQIAIGSGPKCNSAVWVALKTLPGVVGPKQTPPSSSASNPDESKQSE